MPIAPSIWEGKPARGLELYRQRARASWAERIHLYEDIADGKLEQKVKTVGPKGDETVTIYTPSAKDRIAAMEKLAEYGHVDGRAGGQGGGGTDLPTLIRALSAVMSDPVTRRNLMADPRVGDTLKLLAAEPVPFQDVTETGATASGMPGVDAETPDGA